MEVSDQQTVQPKSELQDVTSNQDTPNVPDDQEDEEALFRLPTSRRAKNLRKRKREDEVDDDPEVVEKLEAAREYQLLRERKHGFDMSASAVGYSTARKKRDDEIIGRLDENFTVHNEGKPLLDRRLEEFIEVEMEKRKQMRAQGVEPEKLGAKAGPTSEAELEAQTALRVPTKNDSTDGSVANANSLNGGPDKAASANRGPRWATTVVEVELPAKYKLQAIKETEEMLKKLQDEQKSKPAPPAEVPSEYSVNFQKPYQQPMSHGGRATDDLVYERFKKRFNNR